MLYRCENCGAPLDVTEGQRVVSCTYCGRSNRVRTFQTGVQPQTVQPPQGIQIQAPAVRGRGVAEEPVVPPSSGNGVAWAISITLVLVVVGATVASFALSNGGGTSLFGGIDPTAAPTLGRVLMATSARTMFARTGTIEGAHEATGLGPGCRGWVPTEPQLTLLVSNYQYVSLTTAASEDLTMVLRDPQGHIRCDDDSGEGTNPRISSVMEPGLWTVWVGTYHENARAPYNLLVDAQGMDARPDATGLAPDATPTVAALNLDTTPGGTTLGDMVSGLIDGRLMGPGCHGWFSPPPQATVTTSRPTILSLRTSGGPATVIAVRTAEGLIQCSSVGAGQLTAPIPAGRSGVWVGSTEEGHMASFSLTMAPLGQMDPAGARTTGNNPGVVLPGGPPSAGVINLDTAPSGRLNAAVFGRLPIAGYGAGCAGYLDARPTALIETAVARNVRIRATSPMDTVMLVRTAAGQVFCSDDADGTHDPRLDLSLPAGRHTVYVGTYAADSAAEATVTAQNLDLPRAAVHHGGK